jgi:hypothetical protein
MKKAVAVTTIHPPTSALRFYSNLPDCRLFVAGDRKTPEDWFLNHTGFLPFGASGFPFETLLPPDHYCRKMLAYLAAMAWGATVIIDTDDDNLPGAGWAFPDWLTNSALTQANAGFINVYRWFTSQKIWPRGLPLNAIHESANWPENTVISTNNIGIWQGLADQDPDVDALYRLSIGQHCNFLPVSPLVLAPGTFSPFNSQNTAFRKEVFPLLYLPVSVNFRFTDILRSYVAQPILWQAGYQLGFCAANVVHQRNYHNLLEDLADELPMYRYVAIAAETSAAVVSSQAGIGNNLINVYEALAGKGIVKLHEPGLVEHWLRAVETYTRP